MQSHKTIVYSSIIGDLFHYGHLKMLETAKKSADYHICGVISDAITEVWAPPLICKFEERKGVVSQIKYVDEAILQDSLDPTDNLKKIHAKYPHAKLMLVHTHIFGGTSVLGEDFISSINGEVIIHQFYSNLSREFIKKAFLKDISHKHNIKEFSVNDIKIGDIDYFKTNFSTKANTIKNLRKVLKNAIIEKEFIFSVEQWENEPDEIINKISEKFPNTKIVIRSSNLSEDSVDFSNAGFFESVLNINSDNLNEIKSAIDRVISSYLKGNNYLKNNQVLVQRQTQDVLFSGVLFTRNLWTNTPYYLINYDDKSNRTDTVTSGLANNRVEILKTLALNEIGPKWHNLISAVREIEMFFKGLALDIEFAIKTNGDVVIFQVRPLAANTRFQSSFDDLIVKEVLHLKQKYHSLQIEGIVKNLLLQDNKLYLSDMAFWNPAELIGDRPNHLDFSLFNYLLMKTNWNEALIPLGYSKLDEPLCILMANKPYINIQSSFFSLLPEDLPKNLKRKLLIFYNKKIKSNPELHDKIEFEIVHNCYRFDFELQVKELLENGFSDNEIITLKTSLLKITNNIILSYKKTIKYDNADIVKLEKNYKSIKQSLKNNFDEHIEDSNWRKKLQLINQLIFECKKYGTTQFSRVARMAFIGGALIQSLQNSDVISVAELADFKNSMRTVATELDEEFSTLRNENIKINKFIEKYGHLRPGTYDITKLTYEKNISYLFSEVTNLENKSQSHFELMPSYNEIKTSINQRISNECKKHGIKCDGNEILDFIKDVTELREYYKFIYTKNISLAIELIAEVGDELGFDRKQLSNLDFYTIIGNKELCTKQETIEIWQSLIQGRMKKKEIEVLVSLPPIIFSEQDFDIVPSYISRPNFITNTMVEGDIVFLDSDPEIDDISGKIIVIEKADPGYDWIFTKNIKGLITKYGGAASHMAIRCAEFNIPAAIGCGDVIFSQILKSGIVILDCNKKTINLV